MVKIEIITIIKGFCTLFTSVIVKMLFRQLQQVVLKEYFKSFHPLMPGSN